MSKHLKASLTLSIIFCLGLSFAGCGGVKVKPTALGEDRRP